jgi:hypothetical protein
MNRVFFLVMIISFFSFTNNQVHAQKEPILEAETGLCETYRYALINSLREPVDKAVVEIYKDDPNAPEGLTWATYDTEVLKIKQVYGVGGLYEITLKIYPYYRSHMGYGEDEVVINTVGKLIKYKHLKTYVLNERVL